MAAVGARAAGVLGRNGYQQPSPPQRLVLQLAAQLERRSIQNGAVQSRLGVVRARSKLPATKFRPKAIERSGRNGRDRFAILSGVKKKKAGSATAKGKAAPRNVAEYLARVPAPARSALSKMRAAIRRAVPREARETISYRMPAFKKELKSFSTSKGTIHFPLNKPLPLALIEKIVKARVAQLEAKPTR